MATLYITEFAEIQGGDNNGKVPVVKLPPLAEQTVAIGAETDSAAFNAATKFIRVHCDAICSIKVARRGTQRRRRAACACRPTILNISRSTLAANFP